MNNLKWKMMRFWLSNNVSAISSMESETLDGGDKEIVSGVISAIITTSDDVIALFETGIRGFEIRNIRKN